MLAHVLRCQVGRGRGFQAQRRVNPKGVLDTAVMGHHTTHTPTNAGTRAVSSYVHHHQQQRLHHLRPSSIRCFHTLLSKGHPHNNKRPFGAYRHFMLLPKRQQQQQQAAMFRSNTRRIVRDTKRDPIYTSRSSSSASTTSAAPPTMSLIQKILTFNGLGPKYPWTFGVGIATAKTGAADILVQTQVEKREKIDWKRVGLFTFFGFAYLGIVQYLIYVNLFSHLFKNAAAFGKMPFREKIRNKDGLKDLGKQIVVDMFVHGPLFFFPCYYIAKESIQGKASVTSRPGEVVRKAMDKYGKNYWEDWVSLWKIWILGDAFVFALPLWARLPANHAISFVYMCILSFMRGSDEEDEETVQ